MKLTELAQTLISNNHSPLPRRRWPDRINVPTKSSGGLLGFGASNVFWQKIHQLRDFTDKGSEKFSEEHQGSTGWEYEMQTIYIDGELYYTTPTSSLDYEKVSSKSRILNVETKLDSRTETLKDEFKLDGKTIITKSYVGRENIKRRNDRIDDNKYLYGFLCHFHSHPLNQISGIDHKIYTFFSRQDLYSFMSGNQLLMGLVTDRVWLLGKTSEAEIPDHRELHTATQAEAFTPERLIQVAGDLMSRHEWALYVAGFDDSFFLRVA